MASFDTSQLAAHQNHQQREVDQGDDGGRHGEADMTVATNEHRVHQVINDDGAEADEHRRARVFQRVEGGREHLDRGVAGQADGIGN